MAEKKLSTIKKYLTPYARLIAEQLVNKVGGTNRLLSGGVIALSKLKPEERDKIMEEIHKSVEVESIADLDTAVRTIIKIYYGQDIKIQMLPDEEKKIADFIFKTLGPKENRHHHLKNKNA